MGLFVFMVFPFFLLTAERRAAAGPPAKADKGEVLETAYLAGGCFWCLEADMEKLDGVKKVISGYTGGNKDNPSYEEVSGGSTGHLEAVQVFFDPKTISYSQILDVFWRKIDPTDSGGQFADRGPQYSSAIFYRDERQKALAERSKKELETKGPFKKAIVTAVLPFKNFYRAESYHQDYHKKNKLKYFIYRHSSGRDRFLKKMWGRLKGKPISRDEISAPGGMAGPPQTSKPKSEKKSACSSYFKPSLEEIKRKLNDLQFQVTQKNGTEPPFQNKYWDHKEPGIYADIVSGEPLFSSLDKYDSKTGWPSFAKPLVEENIITKTDRKLLAVRTEVRSKYGDSHLGHVFEDGHAPLGLRYCINSAALRFIPKNKLKEEGYGAFLPLFN